MKIISHAYYLTLLASGVKTAMCPNARHEVKDSICWRGICYLLHGNSFSVQSFLRSQEVTSIKEKGQRMGSR